MTAETVLDDPGVLRRGLTRAQYDVLVATGELEGQPVELLEGAIVEMVPQGPEHGWSVGRLTTRLVRALPESVVVRPQTPFAASGRSEPEPDIAVVDELSDSRSHHPATAHLIIEVAATSHRVDLVHKARIYARSAVPQYWVLDLPANEVVVHREPVESAYASVERLPLTTPLTVLGVDVVLAELLH